jgi:hypothetical protein
MSSRFMKINEYVPNKASLRRWTEPQGCGISQADSIDLEAYAKLQNIQNYVSLSTTSFRNSCAD